MKFLDFWKLKECTVPSPPTHQTRLCFVFGRARTSFSLCFFFSKSGVSWKQFSFLETIQKCCSLGDEQPKMNFSGRSPTSLELPPPNLQQNLGPVVRSILHTSPQVITLPTTLPYLLTLTLSLHFLSKKHTISTHDLFNRSTSSYARPVKTFLPACTINSPPPPHQDRCFLLCFSTPTPLSLFSLFQTKHFHPYSYYLPSNCHTLSTALNSSAMRTRLAISTDNSFIPDLTNSPSSLTCNFIPSSTPTAD